VLIGARVVTAVGILDLDHVRAEIGERLRAGWAGDHTGEVDDQQTIERSQPSRPSRGAFRQLRFGGHKALPYIGLWPPNFLQHQT
jgi:hypothetical protein